MDDILLKRQSCWNERLKKCMNDKGYTQESLASEINKRYGTHFTQKNISRWTNLGETKNGVKAFPDFKNMIFVADFLGVDIGYLTGETDEESFTLEKACSYIGLSGEALKSIRKFTNPENQSNYMNQDMQEAFNRFFTANEFPNFFHSLFDLYLTSLSPKRLKECKFETLDDAIDYIRNSEYTGKLERYELNEALILLINEIYPKPSLSDLSIKE